MLIRVDTQKLIRDSSVATTGRLTAKRNKNLNEAWQEAKEAEGEKHFEFTVEILSEN